jgi:hypothetical protein
MLLLPPRLLLLLQQNPTLATKSPAQHPQSPASSCLTVGLLEPGASTTTTEPAQQQHNNNYQHSSYNALGNIL